MGRFRSRKFWLAVASFVAAVLAEVFGVEVDPEVVLGAAAVVLSWIGVEGWLDRANLVNLKDMERQFLEAQVASLVERLKEVGEFGESEASEEGGFPAEFGEG